MLDLLDFWKLHNPATLEILISDDFFLPFSRLMEREIFSKKRHEKKVSFADAKIAREIFGVTIKNLLLM